MGVFAVYLSLAVHTNPLPHVQFVMATRRTLIARAGAGLVLPAAAACAFDLPPLDFGLTAGMIPYTLEDEPACRKYAAMPNPDPSKQQISAAYAVSTGDMESLKAMADGGWSLAELADDAGKTLLHRAAQIGNEPATSLLLKAGSPIDAYTNFKETPLHLAVRNNRLACVKVLVEAGASTSALYSKSRDTALSLATKYNFMEIVAYLKSKGAS